MPPLSLPDPEVHLPVQRPEPERIPVPPLTHGSHAKRWELDARLAVGLEVGQSPAHPGHPDARPLALSPWLLGFAAVVFWPYVILGLVVIGAAPHTARGRRWNGIASGAKGGSERGPARRAD
jgi:hypothetical protein